MQVDQDICDDAAGSRFLLVEDGLEAELVYRRAGDLLELVHTGVPDGLGGRGVGGRLVMAAVERARSEGLTLVPRCPFARRWLERHADVASTVSINWSADSGHAGTGEATAGRKEGP